MDRSNETEPPDLSAPAPDTEPPDFDDLDPVEPTTVMVPPAGPPPEPESSPEPPPEPGPASVPESVMPGPEPGRASPPAAPAPAPSGSPGIIVLLVLAAAALIGIAAWLIFFVW